MLQEKNIVTPQTVQVLASAYLSPKQHSPEALQQLYKKYIPTNLIRRSSSAIKIALTVASQALETNTIDYAIFCSAHGELQCGVNLLEDLAKKELLSPANFSLSVHNAASGLFSIIHKIQCNMTSIAAGKRTFTAGIISALAWLKLHAQSRVLVVMFDDHIPEIYQSLDIETDQQYAAAFLLANTPKQTQQLSVTVSYAHKHPHQQHSQQIEALSLYNWLNHDTKQIVTLGNAGTYVTFRRISKDAPTTTHD